MAPCLKWSKQAHAVGSIVRPFGSSFFLDKSELQDQQSDTAAFASLVRDCGDSKDLSQAEHLHSRIVGSPYGQNRYLRNLLIQMHGKCGNLDNGRRVFDGIKQPNQFSWNIMIQAYAQNGHSEDAKAMFDNMPMKDVVTWTVMIVAYAQKGHLEDSRSMFDRMPQRNVVSWTAMLAAYAQNWHPVDARGIFKEMPVRNVVSWNILIAAEAGEKGGLEQAWSLFIDMPHRNVVTWTALISAYAENGHLENSRSMFDKMPYRNVVSWTSMVAAYAQNAHLDEAADLFVCMPERNIVSWSVMIAAYAQSGHCRDALQLFWLMGLEGEAPDDFIFTGILTACAHAGLVKESKKYLVAMKADWGISPTIEHYRCVIDCFGRAGQWTNAEELIDSMPFLPDTVAWTTLLSSCKMWSAGCNLHVEA